MKPIKRFVMNNQQILRADYLDILFDGRNKRYGGYALRRNYAQRAKTAMLLMLSAVSIIVAGPVIASKTGAEVHPPIVISERNFLQDIPMPEPPKPLPVVVPPPPAQTAATVSDPEFVVKPDVQVTEQPPKEEVISGMQIGLVAITGDGLAGPDLRLPGGDKPSTIVDMPVEDKSIHSVKTIEIFPRFSGDMDAYLGSHLHYPEDASQNGIEGRVVVQFVVNTDGTIQDVEVVRSVSRSLDEEATRVVRAMPAWKPGMQNGRAVRVQFSIPILFKIN